MRVADPILPARFSEATQAGLPRQRRAYWLALAGWAAWAGQGAAWAAWAGQPGQGSLGRAAWAGAGQGAA